MFKKLHKTIKELEESMKRIESHIARTLCEERGGRYDDRYVDSLRCYKDGQCYQFKETPDGFKFVSVEKKDL